MILKITGISLLFFVLATTSFATQSHLAQSEALKSALEDATESVETESASVALQKIVDFLIVQTEELNKRLTGLKGLDEEAEEQRDAYLAFLKESREYLSSLEVPEDDEAVKKMASELREWRDETYRPMMKEIINFILVFHTKAVLRVADSRFVKIDSDLSRLVDLEIIEKKPQFLLNEAHIALVAAHDFSAKAEFWLSTTTEPASPSLGGPTTPIRDLVKSSIERIKYAYSKFIEISNLVREALK